MGGESLWVLDLELKARCGDASVSQGRRLIQDATKVMAMQTYMILTPLSSSTPSFSLGGENAPCGGERASQRRLLRDDTTFSGFPCT
jgi:hypothetical protein